MKKELVTQQSWAGGQINKAAWRRDDVGALKTGSKRQENVRIEATEQVVPRPGRRMLTNVSSERAEYVRVAGRNFLITFQAGGISVVDASTGETVASSQGAYPWSAVSFGSIVWTQAVNDIVVCYPGMRPQIVRYDPSTGTWTFLPFAFRTITTQVQEPFYRSSVPGATMTYSVYSGAAQALQCSAAYFTLAMVGSVLSILGQQATIVLVSDPYNALVNIAYRLPTSVACLVDDCSPFLPGQEAEFAINNIKIEVSSVQPGVGASAPGGTVYGVLLSSVLWPPGVTTVPGGQQLVSPLGFAKVTYGPNTSGVAITEQWQEEFMSANKGWPQGCAYDRGRLIFYDFPQKPEAILWGSISAPDIFWVDAVAARLYPSAGTLADNAMLEFIPPGEQGSPRVRHVVGWGDEFAFTDRGIYQIPISASGNPLKPGSVEFRQVSNDGVSPIRPITTQDAIVYINAGLKRCSALKAAPVSVSARPYITDDVSEPHSDLFTSPRAMAVTTGDGPKPERYVYVLNDDGSLVVGKFTADRQFVGWAPWTSALAPGWITAGGSSVYYTVLHGGTGFVETEDLTIYLDSAVPLNALPLSMAQYRPAGSGPLWFLASRTVALMDGLRDLGDYTVDASGNVVPHQPGEDLTSLTIIVGMRFTSRLAPLVPMAGAGESVGQRQHRRKVSKLEVSAQGVGVPVKIGKREIPAYRFGDDQSQAAPLRDIVVFIRPLGRDFDPYNEIVIDRPGPWRITEISQEVTV